MALNKTTLQNNIAALLTNNIPVSMRNSTSNPSWPQQESEINTMAAAWADALYDFIVGADVTYATGTLTAPSGGGPVTVTSTTPIATLS